MLNYTCINKIKNKQGKPIMYLLQRTDVPNVRVRIDKNELKHAIRNNLVSVDNLRISASGSLISTVVKKEKTTLQYKKEHRYAELVNAALTNCFNTSVAQVRVNGDEMILDTYSLENVRYNSIPFKLFYGENGKNVKNMKNDPCGYKEYIENGGEPRKFISNWGLNIVIVLNSPAKKNYCAFAVHNHLLANADEDKKTIRYLVNFDTIKHIDKAMLKLKDKYEKYSIENNASLIETFGCISKSVLAY